MKNKITISTLINHVVTTIDLMFKDKYPQYLLDYLYLITYGMILNYGDANIENIYDSLNDIEFDVDEMNRTYKYNFGSNYYFNDITNNNYLLKVYNFKDNSHDISHKYLLHYNKIDNSNIKTLEYLTYSLNLVIFDRIKKVSFYDNFKISFDFVIKGIKVDNLNNDSTINKIFNVLRTENIIKYILDIKNKKNSNKKFSNALKILDGIKKEIYSVEGLNILVNLFKPIYENEDTRVIVDSLSDKYHIENEFDTVLGKNSYKNICKKTDDLNKMVNGCRYGNYQNYYELSTEYLKLRNNYINKYLKLKYI